MQCYINSEGKNASFCLRRRLDDVGYEKAEIFWVVGIDSLDTLTQGLVDKGFHIVIVENRKHSFLRLEELRHRLDGMPQ